ncbi:hypothetical protein L602_002600000510 [Cupriavidus gilardii J11]|uniref:DUF484 family protein n=1 Tax=Cupriavidus gilardii J11 TaxID=936133 RepID=A0A562BJ55_9BURK|nr:DUF484 family protein [Cupriavidus gilardii]TWG85288.1 hypothetical protein L602_002600000510 [Cupriavidus gilardii J11]
MNPQDVAAYLQDHPQFFEDHAELLASVQLTSPHSHRAVSLQQRQMEILREKNKHLELRLADLLRHGHDNDRTQRRMHAWQLRLLAQADARALPAAVRDELQQIFEVPAVALRLWHLADGYADLDVAQTVGDDVRLFAEGLKSPFCGANTGFEAAGWLGRDDIASLAMVALRVPQPDDDPAAADDEAAVPVPPAPAFGLLVMGSPDPRRFHEGMGTAYLTRMGELASAALARLHA